MPRCLHDIALADRPLGVYRNEGNQLLLNFLSPDVRTILDIGCGAGDNARVIRTLILSTSVEIVGITLSSEEAALAAKHMAEVHVVDLDNSDFSFLGDRDFDAIILSHVLEHLKDPVGLLRRAVRRLRIGGQMLIAVPNILEYKNRLRLLMGHFEYEDSGIMDRTHLRFFTWHTVDRYLISPVKELKLMNKIAEGAAPLWMLRRMVFSSALSRRIDSLSVRLLPNLFGWQIVISAVRIPNGL